MAGDDRDAEGGTSWPVRRTELTHPDGVLMEPHQACGTGVLVLAGSSGRVDAGRAAMLAQQGATAMSIRWFGGPGQQPGPCEVPLETFTRALDVLARSSDRLAMVGTSFGAEAALVVAATDPRVEAVVAMAPSAVVWAGVPAASGGEQPEQTSHWTLDGRPLPFVPLDEEWRAGSEPPTYRGSFEASLRRCPRAAVAATIPVERIRGEVVLVAGEDDQVWPATDFARAIASRRSRHGLPTHVVTHPAAGHRTVLPGEQPVVGGAALARGGTPQADVELGRLAWPVIAAALRLRGSRG